MISEVEFECGPKEAPVKVVITSEGEMYFPDYDITYDEGCLEFGYPKTEALELRDRWDDNPLDTIYKEIGVPWFVKAWLALETAEHVFPILEKNFDQKTIAPVRRCLDLTRKTLLDWEGEETEFNVIDLRRLNKIADEHMKDIIHQVEEPYWRIRGSCTFAAMAIWAAAAMITDNAILTGSAGRAMAYDSITDSTQRPRSPDFYEAICKQKLWEINRFVELANIILSRGMTTQDSSDK